MTHLIGAQKNQQINKQERTTSNNQSRHCRNLICARTLCHIEKCENISPLRIHMNGEVEKRTNNTNWDASVDGNHKYGCMFFLILFLFKLALMNVPCVCSKQKTTFLARISSISWKMT